jgi:nicotinate-nucleotide adenylyltransferase
VSEIEGEMGGESRTIDTLEELRRRHPSTRFSMLIGADLVETLPRWKRYEDLVRDYEIFVVGRGSVDAPTESIAIPDISSTALRAALEAGEDELPSQWMDAEALVALRAAGVFARK